jgi:benzaldehyde dehydrogenase (NAD)
VLDSSPGGSYDQLFYRPTVLANVPPEARAYKEEIFGPVAPSVAFNAVDKAARFAAQPIAVSHSPS